jgi:alpha-glucosidase (family GH31 glycosyl hydrolase)
MFEAMQFRAALSSYVYTLAHEAYLTSIGPLRPCYYNWPEASAAYTYDMQYMVGDDLLVRPVAVAVDNSTGLTEVEVWVPPGDWVEWGTNLAVLGDAVRTVQVGLADMPRYARGGSVLALLPETQRNTLNRSAVVWTLFPSISTPTGTGQLYEVSESTADAIL